MKPNPKNSLPPRNLMSVSQFTPGKEYVSDVEDLRKNAREDLKSGAVTKSYRPDKEIIVSMLQQALATEFVCVLRYRKHSFMARGLESDPVAQEFLNHSNEELEHADRLAARIAQLGGEPDLNPANFLDKSHAEYKDVKTLKEMVDENLVAERIAIDSYRGMIDYIGADDSTTRRMLEDILAVEEEHANELKDLLS